MKKNLIYAGMLLLGMTVATSCSNEESLEQVWNDGNTVQAVIENLETRTSVSDDYKVLWTTGDQFDVWNGDTKAGVLELKSGDGTVSGTFGLPTDANVFEVAEGMTAFFPTNATADVKTYTFATSYTSQETDAPMLGTFADGKFTFSLLTAMVRVTVADVPQGEAVLTISSTNETLTGEATLNNNALEVSSNGDKDVTVTVQNGAVGTLTFDVPVPAQSYSAGLSVVLKVDDTEVFSKKTNAFTAEKGKIYVFGTAIASGKDALMAAFANGGDVTLTDDVTLTEAVTIAAGTSVNIDLNGKTLTTSSSTVGSDDITVAGTLNISNGSVESANTAFYVNGGELALEGCEITTTSRYATVYAANNGKVTAKDVTANVANTAFFANSGVMNLTECTVTNTDGAYNVVSVKGGAVLTIDGGSYTSAENAASHDESYTIAVKNSKATIIDATVSGGNGGVTVLESGTATLTGGSYSGVKACGLYVNGNSTVTYENCTFSGVEGDVVVGSNGGTVNGATHTAYTKIQ